MIMLAQYASKDRAPWMLEFQHTAHGDQWVPMQYPPDTNVTAEAVLQGAREYILERGVTAVRVLHLTARENTWRVVRTITKTITEKERT